jgi:hypothetical protein
METMTFDNETPIMNVVANYLVENKTSLVCECAVHVMRSAMNRACVATETDLV